ncbi:HET-domain-containing protein [Delitschia confertaspora ATCC 74209]|uniref:HET-domain-containing protein n=1 Tax=Delitschia confertaspora ATCC 74209 TaxID=1513339 RepID=A0A9P4MTI9_9PLEO|nr:HET-domain-containing protein [Delitschia confertaspora ATCC 74209]
MSYAPLNPSIQQIRLLVLSPGDPDAPITCSTDTVSLLDFPSYEALSYVWGSPLDPPSITFNGHERFPVTANLFTALKYLRYRDRKRVLWVDAVCINQKDIEERNAQVRLMGEIYKGARPVLVWLGQEDEGSDEALGLLSSLDQESIEGLGREEEITLFSFYFELVKKPWFTRIWTVQELVLAMGAEPLVGLGWKWVSWTKLFRIWDIVSERQFSEMPGISLSLPADDTVVEESQTLRPVNIKLALLNNLRAAITNNGGDNLRNLLLNTHTSQATEPRDRIFAIRGMLHSSEQDGITVDYARPVSTVYAEAVAHIFRKGQGPAFLAGCKLAGPAFKNGEQEEIWPSWLPRFGAEKLLSGSKFFPPSTIEGGVSGVGGTATNGEVDVDLRTLRIKGMWVDAVKERIVFGRTMEECIGKLRKIENLIAQAGNLAEENKEKRPYLHGYKGKEPLWRVLVTDKKYSAGTFDRAPEKYGEMYETLLNRLPGSSFFITDTGFFGIGPATIENGDSLAIWFGAPVPFVLRHLKRSEGSNGENVVHLVVGVAYVAGIMDGEMVDEVYCEDLEDDTTFIIQ